MIVDVSEWPTRADPGDKKRKSKAEKHRPTLRRLLEDSAD